MPEDMNNPGQTPEQMPEQAVEPAVEPAAEPTVEPAATPVPEPVVEPATEPAVEPAATQVTEQAPIQTAAQGPEGYWGNPPAISDATGTGSNTPVEPAPQQPLQPAMAPLPVQPAAQQPMQPGAQQPLQPSAPQTGVPTEPLAQPAQTAQQPFQAPQQPVNPGQVPPSPYTQPQQPFSQPQQPQQPYQAPGQPTQPYAQPQQPYQQAQQPYAPGAPTYADPNRQQQSAQPQVPYNAQPGQQFYGQPYPAQPQQKKSKAVPIIIGVIVVLLLMFGGCAACTAMVASSAGSYSRDELYMDDNFMNEDNYDYDISNEMLRNDTARAYFGLEGELFTNSENNLTAQEMETIKGKVKAGKAGENQYAAGYYVVGTDIPAGTYWIDGEQEVMHYFFIFDPDDAGKYETEAVNHYYGNNIATLEAGDIFVVDNESWFTDISNAPKVEAPYKSGVYRVGEDIPAGTYTVKKGPVADDTPAWFIMSSLDYTDDDMVTEYSQFYGSGEVSGPDATVELMAGTYVEFYNLEATPQTT